MATTKDAPNLHLDFVEIVAPRLFLSTSYATTYLTSTPSAKIDVSNPGSGWLDCGTITAVKLPISKEVFEHKAGVPQTSRKQWEIGRSFQVAFNTKDLTPYVEALIMGSALYNQTASFIASSEHVASIYADGERRRKYVKISKGTDIGVKQYDLVGCASNTSASIKDSYNVAVVESYAASLITLEGAGFPIDPVVGDRVSKLRSVEFIDNLGSDVIRSALLFWDTLVSSGTSKLQHVLYIPKLRNYSGGDFDTKDAVEPYDVGVTLSAQAVSMTFGDGSTGYNFYKKWVLNY